MTWRTFLGGVSGGTLGFILGDVAGARYGASLGSAGGAWADKRAADAAREDAKKDKRVPTGKHRIAMRKSLQMKRKQSEPHAPAVKKTKTKKGRKMKRKMRRRAREKKKATKFVKDIVKRELHCKADIGVYNKCYTSDLRCANDINDEVTWLAGARYRNQLSGQDTERGLQFQPHTLNKILDAASIVYNGKTKAINWESTTNNFDIASLKLNLIYASYKLEIFNMEFYPHEVTIYEVTNKTPLDTSFLTNVDNNVGSMKWVGGAPAVTQLSNSHWSLDFGLEPSMVKGIEKQYRIRKVAKKVLMPGSKMHYFSKLGPHCIDYAKHRNSTGGMPFHLKGDKQVVLRIRPMMHVTYNTAASGGADVQATFIQSTQSTAAGSNFSTFGFYTEEVYKFEMPGETDDAREGSQRVMFTRVEKNPSDNQMHMFIESKNNLTSVLGPP